MNRGKRREIENCPECQRKSRPLDRGKVLAFAEDKKSILKAATKNPGDGYFEGAAALIDYFIDKINSGRLDVDHIEDTLGMVKEEE